MSRLAAGSAHRFFPDLDVAKVSPGAEVGLAVRQHDDAIVDVIRELIADTLGIPAAQITPDSCFVDFGIDSIQVIDLVVELERRFDVSIHDDDIAQIVSVGELAGHLHRLRSARG